jgi:hypothetical protein
MAFSCYIIHNFSWNWLYLTKFFFFYWLNLYLHYLNFYFIFENPPKPQWEHWLPLKKKFWLNFCFFQKKPTQTPIGAELGFIQTKTPKRVFFQLVRWCGCWVALVWFRVQLVHWCGCWVALVWFRVRFQGSPAHMKEKRERKEERWRRRRMWWWAMVVAVVDLP